MHIWQLRWCVGVNSSRQNSLIYFYRDIVRQVWCFCTIKWIKVPVGKGVSNSTLAVCCNLNISVIYWHISVKILDIMLSDKFALYNLTTLIIRHTFIVTVIIMKPLNQTSLSEGINSKCGRRTNPTRDIINCWNLFSFIISDYFDAHFCVSDCQKLRNQKSSITDELQLTRFDQCPSKTWPPMGGDLSIVNARDSGMELKPALLNA